jgi:choline dehydrogenase-like flavoprotein
MIPNKDSYCEIDPTGVKDKYGIPVLRFHWKWSDYELNQVKHMHETFRAILSGMGATVSPMPTRERNYNISAGGQIIHELGGTCMGSDASNSVLNKNAQAWDCKNLFVADGGPFSTQADKNPTWTILALSLKTSDYIAQQWKAGAL